jgi:putative ABC transport system permease protein
MYFSDILSTFRQSKTGTILLVIQAAFTFAVLVNIYAMVDSYTSQVVSESGYVDEDSLIGVTLFQYDQEESNAETIGIWRNQIERDLSTIRSTPGVREVAMAENGIPFQNSFRINNFDTIRRLEQDPGSSVPNTRYTADVNSISLLGLEIIAGRNFTLNDVSWVSSIETRGGPSVIITKTLAEVLFPDEEAVGKQVALQSGHVLTVIGVVKLAKAVYWAPYDDYASFVAGRLQNNQSYLVRLEREASGSDFASAKARTMQALSRDLVDSDLEREVKVETLDELKKMNLGRFIIINSIVGGVAVLLVLVSALGNYGQVSYAALRRTKQIGIRRALGATRQYVFNYFLIENLVISCLGMFIGLFLMVGLNSVIINAMGYGQFKWQHIVTSMVFMLLLSFVSSLLPIMKAMRISPAIATRSV